MILLPLLVVLPILSSPALAQDVVRIPVPDGVQPAADVYVVQPGDTLWDISTTFLGSSEHWPRLWSINDYITNPHWIYPGNRIVFVPGTEIEPPQVSLESTTSTGEGYVPDSVAFTESQTPCGPDVRFDTTRSSAAYQAPGVLEDSEDVEILGEVAAARTGAQFLSEGDLVYLEFDGDADPSCGDVVSILHKVKRKVRKPGGGRYGALYRVAAEARVLHIQDGVATAEVRKSWSEVERGDVISTLVPVDVEMEAAPPKGSLDGTIVARLQASEADLGFTGETVFVDRGRADGVRVGNTFWIVEQRDEFLDVNREDEDLPFAVIGRIVVVRVDENSSTAVVVDANRHVEEGARVTMHLE